MTKFWKYAPYLFVALICALAVEKAQCVAHAEDRKPADTFQVVLDTKAQTCSVVLTMELKLDVSEIARKNHGNVLPEDSEAMKDLAKLVGEKLQGRGKELLFTWLKEHSAQGK